MSHSCWRQNLPCLKGAHTEDLPLTEIHLLAENLPWHAVAIWQPKEQISTAALARSHPPPSPKTRWCRIWLLEFHLQKPSINKLSVNFSSLLFEERIPTKTLGTDNNTINFLSFWRIGLFRSLAQVFWVSLVFPLPCILLQLILDLVYVTDRIPDPMNKISKRIKDIYSHENTPNFNLHSTKKVLTLVPGWDICSTSASTAKAKKAQHTLPGPAIKMKMFNLGSPIAQDRRGDKGSYCTLLKARRLNVDRYEERRVLEPSSRTARFQSW